MQASCCVYTRNVANNQPGSNIQVNIESYSQDIRDVQLAILAALPIETIIKYADMQQIQPDITWLVSYHCIRFCNVWLRSRALWKLYFLTIKFVLDKTVLYKKVSL